MRGVIEYQLEREKEAYFYALTHLFPTSQEPFVQDLDREYKFSEFNLPICELCGVKLPLNEKLKVFCEKRKIREGSPEEFDHYVLLQESIDFCHLHFCSKKCMNFYSDHNDYVIEYNEHEGIGLVRFVYQID